LKQFILKDQPGADNIIKLEDKDYHYLVRVRRLAAGEFFPALLPNGEETLIKIVSIDHQVLTGQCTFTELNPPSLNSVSSVPPCLCVNSSVKLPPIILFQALPKGDKLDLIVRQAAEGGITEVVPFVSEFSVKSGISTQKIIRLERIIKEARQQCGSKIATTLHNFLTMKDLFDYWQMFSKDALGLLFHHQQGLEQESLHGYLNSNPNLVVLVIGPEGGFSEREVSLFLENGFKTFTIGDTILRTETAALYCAAAVRILLLERNLWETK